VDSTSQGESVLSEAEGTPEDARKEEHIRGRSNARRDFVKYPGLTICLKGNCRRGNLELAHFFPCNFVSLSVVYREDEVCLHRLMPRYLAI
jgi:hypothetical protein